MEKGACKNQNAMPHREAVRFAKEKDKTWLDAGSNEHFHERFTWHWHFMVACFAISLFQRCWLPQNSFNMSFQEENKKLLQLNRTILTWLKSQKCFFVFVSNTVALQPNLQFVKMAMFVMCQHAANTFDPWLLKCMLVQNTNLAIALS